MLKPFLIFSVFAFTSVYAVPYSPVEVVPMSSPETDKTDAYARCWEYLSCHTEGKCYSQIVIQALELR